MELDRDEKKTTVKDLTVIRVSDGGRLLLGRVKVGHQGRDVLRGRQPRVNVLARVQEAPRGDRDVLDPVAIERELEAKVDGGCSPVGFRQHWMLDHQTRLGSVPSVQVDPGSIKWRERGVVVPEVILKAKALLTLIDDRVIAN